MVSKRKEQEALSDAEEEPVEILTVDFDFFDLSADVDYHALVNLLKQLLSHDATLFDIGKLVDIAISQQYVGSTVKCDGPESDPYAFATVINLNTRKTEKAVATMIEYLMKQAGSSSLHAQLEKVLAIEGNTGHLGLVLSERLVNIPPQIATPLYRMLNDELQWAREENEPFHFSHLLFLTRVFVPGADDGEERNSDAHPSAKKKKASKAEPTSDVFAYHPEDEVIGKFSEGTIDFSYQNAPERDAVDPFGVETRGRLMLMKAERLGEMAEAMEKWMQG